MGIPESQLETWSHQGAITTSKATHESIRRALTANTSPIRAKDFEIYLQGSYKNDTNIRGDSDVDVVVQLNSAFQSNASALSAPQSQLHQRNYPDASYRWEDFRCDVLKALRAYYRATKVSEGNKSLKIAGESGRLPADVVVCIQYRKYLWFFGPENQNYVDGMVFYTRNDNRQVINFPKPHYDNGVTKNGPLATNGWYKPTVRVFKNARTYMADRRMISDALVPSYFLECLLYNVPNGAFGGTHQQTFFKVAAWLNNTALNTFVCQNGQLPLFGQTLLTQTPEQWMTSSAKSFLSQLVNLWTSW